MDRREYLQAAAVTGVLAATGTVVGATRQESTDPGAFEFDEATFDSLQDAIKQGQETSESITRKYLERIAKVDPLIHSVIELNPDALSIADALDRERNEKGRAVRCTACRS